MIFATVGTQLAFPRLISTLDDLAPGLDEEIIAQVGPDTETRSNIATYPTLASQAYGDAFKRARVVVAHAGIGTILLAKASEKPVILLPRRHSLGEHRNDHQLATARQVEDMTGVYVAWQESDIEQLLFRADLKGATPELGPASATLIDRIRRFTDSGV